MNCNDLIEKDGKIEWVYTTREDDPISYSQWIVWKKAYEDMTNTNQDMHFMSNGFPFIFTRDSLEEASIKFKNIHGIDYSEFCKKRLIEISIPINSSIRENFYKLATIFEEFEWIGYYCMNNSSDYIFTKLRKNKRNYIKQYWSHGGITEEIQSEINSRLNLNPPSP